MKLLISIFLLSCTLYSKTIDNSLLEIHATIMPKILLLKNDVQESIKNNKICISIIYEKNNYKEMKYLKQAIHRKYQDGISKYKIEIEATEYSEFKKCNENTNILYVFPSTKKNIVDIVEKHKACSAVTFASDKEFLKNNVMFSIDVSKKVKPVINLKAVKDSGISFRPVLLSISKVYKNDE